ncbi:MAG: RNA methyltransferase [Candidatus Methanomethyliaceae archaeon]|nr:RNA methyltransferase [Candidatus Methanomethyliaceae archaeon]
MTTRRPYTLTICLPSSVLSLGQTLIEKTIIAGQVARAASIYRVDNIVIYLDKQSSRDDAILMKDLLTYAETPQYLRRYLFSLSKNLKYAALIPPLRTPHHPLSETDSKFREGFVLKSNKKESIVDIGLKEPVKCPSQLPINRRISMKFVDGTWLPASREEIQCYWGYQTQMDLKGLGHHLISGSYDYVIATSRLGVPVNSVVKELKNAIITSQSIAILFGAPDEGLHEILRKSGLDVKQVSDVVVNMVPNQGTETVRTEEALLISLAVFTFIEHIDL